MTEFQTIPEWIQESEVYEKGIYKSFDGKYIPICELNISSLDDFQNVLDVINFWKIESPFPYEIWEYIFASPNEVKEFLSKDRSDKTSQYFLDFITCENGNQLLDLIMVNNEINFMTLICEDKIPSLSWNENICNSAAYYNNLVCLKFCHENGCPWNKWTTHFAAVKGNFECLLYCLDNECPIDYKDCIDVLSKKFCSDLDLENEELFAKTRMLREYLERLEN